MRGSKLLLLAAGLGVLTSCGGSADDLKARWLTLPTPPPSLIQSGPGTAEIAALDLANTSFPFNSLTFLEPFDTDVYPERTYAVPSTPDGGYSIDFIDGAAQVVLGEEATRKGVATVDLSFTDTDMYFSDANGDGYQDAMIVLTQQVTYYESEAGRDSGDALRITDSTGILLLTYAEEGIGDSFYFSPGELTDISAITGGFSITTASDGLSDTIEIGWPAGVPVRIDSHGGSLQCADNIDDIRAALEQEPHEHDFLYAYPGSHEIEGYDEYAMFPLPVDEEETNHLLSSGHERMIFLLDGGDINRWTDYRCGWIPREDL